MNEDIKNFLNDMNILSGRDADKPYEPKPTQEDKNNDPAARDDGLFFKETDIDEEKLSAPLLVLAQKK